MEKLALCRVCFKADFNIQQSVQNMIKNTDLEIIYEKLTAMPFQTHDMRPASVCYMCYAQLRNINKFRLKCLRAEDVLTEMLNQALINEDVIDNKATLIQKLSLNSALSVSAVVTVSTDDDREGGEVEDADIKQEIPDERDMDAEDTCEPESSDVNVGHNTVRSEGTSDGRGHSFVVSCKIEESRGTRAIAASAGDDHCGPDEYSDYPYGVPVANELELVSQIKKSDANFVDVTEFVNITKCVNILIENDDEKADVSNLSNEKTITPIVNNDNSKQNNSSDPKLNDPLSSNNAIANETKLHHVTNYKILNSEDLTRYKNKRKRKPQLHICDVCDKTFTKKTNLRRHAMIHTGDKPFTCVVCNKSFNRKFSLDKHAQTHSNYPCIIKKRDNKQYTCGFCSKTFTQQYSLTRHIKTHDGDKPFKCDVCGKHFSRKGHLQRHAQLHTGEKPFDCNVCNKGFSQKSYCQSHMQSHSDVRVSCNICNKRFSQKHYLKIHMRIHTGQRPYTCDYCNKGFYCKGKLVCHIRVHSGVKPYSCNVCKLRFTYKHLLTLHIKGHRHKPYICKVCKRGYSQKADLEYHSRIHFNKKPFFCNVCNKDFKKKFNYVNHIRVHTGNKPFTCDECKKSFFNKNSLVRHIIHCSHWHSKP